MLHRFLAALSGVKPSYNTAFQHAPSSLIKVLLPTRLAVFPIQFSVSRPAFEEYLLVTRSHSQSIRSNARSILNQFERFLAKQDRLCTPDTASELVHAFLANFKHPAYRYTAIYYLRLFFDFLAWPVNPARQIKLPKVNPTSSRKFLEAKECRRLLGLLKHYAAEGCYLREQALVHLVLYTGLRAGEALALQWPDISASGAVLIRDSKTHTSRMAYAPQAVLRLLQRYRQSQGLPSPWVFPGQGGKQPLRYGSIRYRIKALLQEAGCDRRGVNLHSLRHTYARACVEGGLPREIIQQFLGHRDSETTAIYTRLFASDVHRRSPEAHQAVDAFLGHSGAKFGGYRQRGQTRSRPK